MSGSFRQVRKTTLEGRNVVIEAIKGKREIFEILIDQGSSGDKVSEVLSLAKARGLLVKKVKRSDLDKISKTGNHQGVLAICGVLKTKNLSELLKEEKEPFLIVLREVLYEHNLGAIIRTACAVGAHAVVVPPARKPLLTPVVERVSMGASNLVSLVELNTYSALSVLKKAGIRLVGVEIHGTVDLFKADLTGSIALVFGGEDTGLSLQMAKECDIVVRVPMKSGSQSLNQSVVAGIVMYEKVRQTRLSG